MTDSTNNASRKHTPGPWELNDWGLIYGQPGPDDEEAPFVCDVADAIAGIMTDEERANGALIETAPELLEALELAVAALNWVPRFSVPGSLTCSYRVASHCELVIAKAKGERA